MKAKLSIGLAAVAGLLYLGDAARACFIQSPLPVQVWADHIEVDVRDQVCVKKYDCKFLNPNPQAVVGGECFMEVEPGSQVDNMTLTVDGKETEAELLSREQADKIFQDIVAKGGSPALLEFYGNQLIRSRVPRIEPNGTVTVKLQYTTVLKAQNGLVRMQFLNTNPKAALQPLKKASVRINLSSEAPIKNVYSPTHPIRIVETDETDVRVEWEQENYLPKTPFVFYYAVSEESVGANLLATREPGDDGYFMLMVSPTMGHTTNVAHRPKVSPKDVVFCVDTSGSMLQNGQIEQMKGALRHCIERLDDGDRFNIVDFSTEARIMEPAGLLDANAVQRARALRYVDAIKAKGGTAIEEALDRSLGLFDGAPRMKMLLFVTDGTPSIGETDSDKLLKGVSARNVHGARIFVFGVGHQVNARFLDALASDHRGDSDYILPEEKIEAKIGPYFDRVGSPVLSDVQVAISGVQVSEIYPRGNQDLFKGGQLVLFGRYRGSGTADVTLTGKVNGEEQTFQYTVQFPAGETKSDFVPRLWAGRKVNFLLSELRRNGENKEVIDEVVSLAKRFGIVTPYTSFLVVRDEEEPMPSAGAGGRWGQAVRGALERDFRAPAPAEAPAYFERAKGLADARKSDGRATGYDDLAQRELDAAGGKERSSLSLLRAIGTRTFYKVGDEWHESEFEPEKHEDAKTIRLGGEEYFELIRSKPHVAKFLALGRVVFSVEGLWIRIADR